ncbi:RecF/RecN/SMC domain-containing protein [Neofusicoccum parvum]|uniref:RecF/RecN/SMC domain-containing protein n=1 Tax=Neofusicoccum parvum TaxID=310453 RepID=A0ACB5SG08_9PEZI|nr:RecF/RecN/SMC domain-containing protein [Neofusicoccum parvum]
MSVVVEQTIPWSPSTLDLSNPKRWTTLFPLLRPSVFPVSTSKGQTVLLNRALSSSPHIQIAAIGRSGNFSSKFLSDTHIAAIVTETSGAGILTAQDVRHTLEQNGIKVAQGLVVLRAGKERRVSGPENGVVEVDTEGELEFDHLLSLLEHATETARTSIHQTVELLKLFMKTAVTTKSEFHPAKKGENASIVHEVGHAEFETATKALEKDLTHVLRAQASQTGSVTYSVHYSDINGLSQLENYILAHEISNYLDAQNIPYRLSYSPLLGPTPLSARGWAISISALPTPLLAPQPKPPNPLSHPTSPSSTAAKPVSPTATTFNNALVRARITRGCAALIAAEPAITRYDTIVGDGDCGLTLRDGAAKTLSFIADADLGDLAGVLGALVAELEVTMGGTSGALYCIFLSGLAGGLGGGEGVGAALEGALGVLLRYTRARRGDRTCLDALVPFVEALAAGEEEAVAVERAREGVEGTKVMEARLGRSAYLDESATKGVPDPGAYGLLVLLEGLCGVEGGK